MQTEKLTSFYGKTKRERDMGNFKVFAADLPAGPASFQKSLYIGTLSLFDWFEIISCKPQNYLFILFNARSVATTSCSVQLSMIEINTLFN